MQGRNIVYCDDAVFYDEQPTTTKVMFRQRLRWAKGHLLVCLTRVKDLFKKMFRKTPAGIKSNKFSTYDIMVNIMPTLLISLAVSVLQWIFIFLTPLFMQNYLGVWRSHAINFGISTAAGYLGLMLSAILVFICERKRIQGVSFFKKVGAVLLWPVFVFVGMPIELFAAFMKVGWKTIPHTDTTNFEKINGEAVKLPNNEEVVGDLEEGQTAIIKENLK